MKGNLIECPYCKKGKLAYKCGIDKETGKDMYTCKRCRKIFKDPTSNVWIKTHESKEEKKKRAERILDNIDDRRKGK